MIYFIQSAICMHACEISFRFRSSTVAIEELHFDTCAFSFSLSLTELPRSHCRFHTVRKERVLSPFKLCVLSERFLFCYVLIYEGCIIYYPFFLCQTFPGRRCHLPKSDRGNISAVSLNSQSRKSLYGGKQNSSRTFSERRDERKWPVAASTTITGS